MDPRPTCRSSSRVCHRSHAQIHWQFDVFDRGKCWNIIYWGISIGCVGGWVSYVFMSDVKHVSNMCRMWVWTFMTLSQFHHSFFFSMHLMLLNFVASGQFCSSSNPSPAWMSQVFHMLAWGFPNGKGQNFPPKQKQFQQNGLDKFTSTASNESNHGFHADLEEYWPEPFKLPNTQRPHPEDLPLRDVKPYESNDFLTNYTLKLTKIPAIDLCGKTLLGPWAAAPLQICLHLGHLCRPHMRSHRAAWNRLVCTDKLIRVHFNKHNIMEGISFFAQWICCLLAGWSGRRCRSRGSIFGRCWSGRRCRNRGSIFGRSFSRFIPYTQEQASYFGRYKWCQFPRKDQTRCHGVRGIFSWEVCLWVGCSYRGALWTKRSLRLPVQAGRWPWATLHKPRSPTRSKCDMLLPHHLWGAQFQTVWIPLLASKRM